MNFDFDPFWGQSGLKTGSKLDQNGQDGAKMAKMGPGDRFWCQKEAHGLRNPHPFGDQNCPKINQKIDPKTDCFSKRVRARIFSYFAPNMVPKSSQVGTQIAPKTASR